MIEEMKMKTTKYILISAAFLLSPVVAQAASYTDSYTDYVVNEGTTSSSTQTMPDKHMSNDHMHRDDSEKEIIQDHADITHIS